MSWNCSPSLTRTLENGKGNGERKRDSKKKKTENEENYDSLLQTMEQNTLIINNRFQSIPQFIKTEIMENVLNLGMKQEVDCFQKTTTLL